MRESLHTLEKRKNEVLLGLDLEADDRLIQEVDQARERGHDATIGMTEDEAYDHPEKIRSVYEFLDGLDDQLTVERHRAIERGLGRLGINPIGRQIRRAQAIDRAIDPHRVELLFGPQRAVDWHNQRGSASALLSIVSAHDLMVDRDPETGFYETMSGPLDDRIFDYRFGENAGSLSGLSLNEALIQGEVRFKRSDWITAKERSSARLTQLKSFIDAPVSPVFKDVTQYCTDALGIRARREEVRDAIRDHLLDKSEEERKREFLMMSFGCGTALPMLDIVKDLKDTLDINSRLILLDQDPLALASASLLAEDMGLADNIEIHCERLFNSFGQPIKLDTVLKGRQLDVAEDSGLREYLPDMIYRWLTRESWNALKPGGIMTTGNMNRNRPQARFIHGMMGWWPQVRMRTIREGLELHRRAGVPTENTRVRVTRDGVYSMYFTEKPS